VYYIIKSRIQYIKKYTSLDSEPHAMYPSKTDKPTKFWRRKMNKKELE